MIIKKDSSIKNFLDETFKSYLNAVSIFGDFNFYIIVLVFLYFVGLNKLLENLSISLFFVFLIIIPLRLIFFNERPKKIKHKNLIKKIKSSSFPSFHSMLSSILLLFIFTYSKNFIISKLELFFYIIFIIILFISVLFSRYYFKKHFTKDLIVGSILGFIIFIIVSIYF